MHIELIHFVLALWVFKNFHYATFSPKKKRKKQAMIFISIVNWDFLAKREQFFAEKRPEARFNNYSFFWAVFRLSSTVFCFLLPYCRYYNRVDCVEVVFLENQVMKLQTNFALKRARKHIQRITHRNALFYLEIWRQGCFCEILELLRRVRNFILWEKSSNDFFTFFLRIRLIRIRRERLHQLLLKRIKLQPLVVVARFRVVPEFCPRELPFFC